MNEIGIIVGIVLGIILGIPALILMIVLIPAPFKFVRECIKSMLQRFWPPPPPPSPPPPPLPPKEPLIHRSKLAKFGVIADEALTQDVASLSCWQSPEQWLEANAHHIRLVASEIAVVNGQAEEAQFVPPMIYERLIVYLVTHLSFCTFGSRRHSDIESLPDRQPAEVFVSGSFGGQSALVSVIDEFKNFLQQWQDWDEITLIEEHQSIRTILLGYWQHLGDDSHPTSLLKKLLSLDDAALYAHLVVLIKNKTQYKQILSLRDQRAQTFLDLLQSCLDFPTELSYKPRLVKALILLARNSRRYPQSLIIEKVSREDEPVGRGGFADVYKGRFQHKSVAIKILRVYQRSDVDKIMKEFTSEAVTWRQLSHPNVLLFHGIYRPQDTTIGLVSPWMDNGTVVQFLADCPHEDRVLLSLDVAQGLEYLHNEGVVHGDLKGINILVSRSRKACIADFGLSTAIHSTTTAKLHATSEKVSGTLRWQAPEFFPDMRTGDSNTTTSRTKATDIYAFGCVCYEIFSGKYPFHDIDNDFRIMLAVQQGIRPTRPSQDLCQARGLNNKIWHLITSCWVQIPSRRPTAKYIVQQLQALVIHPDPRSAEDDNVSSQSISDAMHPYSYPPGVPSIYQSQYSFNVPNPSRLPHEEYDKPFSTLMATEFSGRTKGVDGNIRN